ncbi:dead deah box rna [Nannochloropsis gaditana]|uniref:Dead deah box rna n=2 Tax=Nannochloropsis gaditana TaxID=72520 RepID=W7TSS5_9STRA|nr:dead deah box rna [Nannochloropsis gaditana]
MVTNGKKKDGKEKNTHPDVDLDSDPAKGVEDDVQTFEALGVVKPLCEACAAIGWTKPTGIQQQAIPAALQGRDVIGLAETGSGKTGAFALPVLQALLAKPQRLFAVVLAPTRELAFQIHEVFEALGASIGLKSCCVVGGVDMMTQAIALARKPHVVVATPGRLVDHLENTKGFHIREARFLVLDEADRMLSMDFEEEINKILAIMPTGKHRRTLLFSATMTSKVAKLQRASLTDPVKVEASDKFTTPRTLVQQYLFIPAKYKDCYLAYALNEAAGQTILVFVATCNNAQRLALLLRNLGFGAICLHGQMTQPKRLGALHKFKSGQRSILIATDVASRGLDIPAVDLVINFDIPSHGKDYIHRVGRTARAGRAGRSIAMVTQYDVEVYQRLEALLGTKLPEYKTDEETVLILLERVSEAQRIAARELRELTLGGGKKGGRKRGRDGEGDEDEGGEGGREAGGKPLKAGQGALKRGGGRGRTGGRGQGRRPGRF